MNTRSEAPTGQNQDLNTDWHILVRRDLLTEAGAADAPGEWLIDVMQPLDLPAEIREAILQFALKAVMRVRRGEAARVARHLSFTLFITAGHARRGQGWGFFRVKMIEEVMDDPNSLRHAIEFSVLHEN